MSDINIAYRYISNSSNYSNSDLRNGDCDMKVICENTTNLTELPIYIDDSSGMTVMELRAKTNRMIAKHKIGFVIVDYLQLMAGSGDNREQVVAGISRGLKAMAKDLKIPVLALSQLNRESESGSNRIPQLSQLRESGAIEQDADLVLMLYRPILYSEPIVEINGRKLSPAGLIVLNVAKQRNGPVGTLPLLHNESVTKIEDYPPDVF
jgi:replicative DNA helicase